jgi:hypothetical protein
MIPEAVYLVGLGVNRKERKANNGVTPKSQTSRIKFNTEMK